MKDLDDQTLVGDINEADLTKKLRDYATTPERREVVETLAALRPMFLDLMVREALVLTYLFGLDQERSFRYVGDDMVGKPISHEMIYRIQRRARHKVAADIRNCRDLEVFFKETVRVTNPHLYMKISKDLNDGLDLQPLPRRNKGKKKKGG